MSGFALWLWTHKYSRGTCRNIWNPTNRVGFWHPSTGRNVLKRARNRNCQTSSRERSKGILCLWLNRVLSLTWADLRLTWACQITFWFFLPKRCLCVMHRRMQVLMLVQVSHVRHGFEVCIAWLTVVLRGFQSERAASHVGHIVEVGQEQCHQRGTVGWTLQVYPAHPHRDLWWQRCEYSVRGAVCVCVVGVVKINAIKIKINAWVCSDGSNKDLSDSEVCVGCNGGCLLAG